MMDGLKWTHIFIGCAKRFKNSVQAKPKKQCVGLDLFRAIYTQPVNSQSMN